ncbi:pyocin knob domain-containing protein [Eubacterium maltosivorans]|uniref:pyocin knob domain-containing protein n=1 Tax=Eubacterium maltosivorans TaxID=2041044 RepID=UPI0018A07632|nr:pyocin knob domain-containing protein [Eubacterium maltosivorans]
MVKKLVPKGRYCFYMATASKLNTVNPLLDAGQMVYESDSLLGKLGDGVRRWNELPYASYIHPSTAGNKHIPAGGSDSQFLGWDSNGVAKWVNIPLSYFGIMATAAEINYLKALTGPVQDQLNGKAPSGHKHTKSQITDFPVSLPANGGNADTVDGKHAADLQNYNNLTNKPSSFPPSGHTHTKSQITDFPESLPAAGGDADTVDGKHAAELQNYNNLTNKPSTFPPSSHNHTKAQITDFPASLPANGGNADTVDGKHAADLQNYNNLTNKPSSFPPSGHTHPKSQITDFPSSLPANGGTASYSNYLNVNNIAANTNLNNLTTPGFYYCPANATVGTLANSPTTNAFFMIVGKHAGVYQEIVEYVTGNPKRFMRNQYSGSWGSWYRVFTTGNVPTYAEVGAAPSTHYHDDRYYTESEMNTKLAGKVDTTDSRLTNARPASDVYAWAKASVKPGYGWTEISGKPSTFPPSGHTHPASQITGVGRSITFGITTDFTSSSGHLVLNKTFAAGSPDYRDADTSLASLSSGNISIKKTGRYLVVFNGELTVANITANPQFQIYCLPKNINLANGSFGLWADRYKGNVSGVAMLDAGDTIQLLVNFLSAGGASYGFKKGDTYCSLIYLGEK